MAAGPPAARVACWAVLAPGIPRRALTKIVARQLATGGRRKPGPPRLFALPLYRKPAFPGFYQILQVQSPAVFRFLQQLRGAGQDAVGGFLAIQEPSESPEELTFGKIRCDAGPVDSSDNIYRFGTTLTVLGTMKDSLGGGQVVVVPGKRVKIIGEGSANPAEFPLAGSSSDAGPSSSDAEPRSRGGLVWRLLSELGVDRKLDMEGPAETDGPSPLLHYPAEPVEDFPSTGEDTKAVQLELVATLRDLLATSNAYKEQFEQIIRFYDLDYPGRLADAVAAMSLASREEMQSVLEEADVEKRLRLALDIAKRDAGLAQLQMRVRADVEERVNRDHKRFMLQEQLKLIKHELGIERDEKAAIVEEFREAAKRMPDEPKEIVDHEIRRLRNLEISSAEFSIARTYIEWMTQMPWDTCTTDISDIAIAAGILEQYHYGLRDVKERLLEFLAVNALRQEAGGRILCLMGPPGVGKSSAARAVAEALGRKFFRFSLGGLFDIAELRGHRRTYVGAMPGKFVQALRSCGSANPVILLDEIDKLGRDFRGDPTAALLEVLDPAQNATFRDHYMDVPVDLSRVLFICTANASDTIPPPLLDRLEVIRLPGYIHQDKLQIATRHLIPQVQGETGLDSSQVSLSDTALEMLVRDFSRESGVRQLRRLLERIHRKAALQIVRSRSPSPVEVDESLMREWVGGPAPRGALYDVLPVGVARGLAWTPLGGEAVYVEARAQAKEGEKGLRITGQVGPVMQESCQIALSFARGFVRQLDGASDVLDTCSLHVHVPEGAVSKDGPSAGITVAAALVSLALDRPPPRHLAMTGELTLTGKVLPVGGIQEKLVAAAREGVLRLVAPEGNRRDIEQLPACLSEGISFCYASTFDAVFEAAFPPTGSSKAD